MSSNLQSSDKFNKVQTELQKQIGTPVVVEFNVATINQFAPDQQSHAAEFFTADGYWISFKNAFANLCKVNSGKAWLGQFQKIFVNACPEVPGQKTDAAFTTFVQPPMMTVTINLKATKSLRNAYNARSLEDSIIAAMPQLKTGQDMDKITASGKIEKTQQELQQLLGTAVQLDVNLFSISSMPIEDCQHAAEFVHADGLYITFKNAFAALTKVGSGKAWLSRFQFVSVTFFSDHNQKTDSVFAVSAAEPALTVNISLKTNKSLRNAYNARALEEALTTSLPQLKVGKDIDQITSSGKLDKTLDEVRKAIENPALVIDFDLFAISNMPVDDCKHAAEFVHADGYFISFKNAFAALCKVGSGKAWLQRFQKIAVTCTSNHDQKTDSVFTVQAQEPVLAIQIALKTNKSLRNAYNARALEEAVCEALPQLKTGQEMDKITASQKLEKTLAEVQKAIENPALTIDFDLFSISNMPLDDCKHASEFVHADGYFITFKNAFGALCKVGSGKAWLQRFQKFTVTCVINHDQKTDSAFVVQAQEPVLAFTISLKTNKSLRNAYNARALEDAVCDALPQLRTGQEMDKITASGKIEKTQTEIRNAVNNQNLFLELDLFSISNMPFDDCKHAAEFVHADGLFISFKNGFAAAMKKEKFAQMMGQIQKVQVGFTINKDQKTDSEFTAQANGPVLQIQTSLKTSKSLRNAYNARAFEEAVCKAAGM